MKGKQLLEIIDSGAPVFVKVETSTVPTKVKIDVEDLRDEILYTTHGELDLECGIVIERDDKGSFLLVTDLFEVDPQKVGLTA